MHILKKLFKKKCSKCLTLKVVSMWSNFEDSEDQKWFTITEKPFYRPSQTWVNSVEAGKVKAKNAQAT